MTCTLSKILLAVLVSAAALIAVAPSPASAANGCGSEGTEWVPDSWLGASFTSACNTHDDCYAAGSTTDRKVCDQGLAANMKAACDAEHASYNPLRYDCYDKVGKYYAAVRAFGEGPYAGSGDPS